MITSKHTKWTNSLIGLLSFLISNKFIDIKKEHPTTQGVLLKKKSYTGSVQGVKQFKNKNYKNLRNQKKKKNDWFCKAANQSIKVLKKNNLRSSIDLSLSSKHLLFLSLQRHHNKQWGAINHIYPFR